MSPLARPALTAALTAACAALAIPVSAGASAGFFHTPSGNIGCNLTSDYVRCDIQQHSWTSPARPKWYDVDYGGGLQVGKRHRATFVCAGDTTLHQGRVLAYGSSTSAGRFTCTSRPSGVTCRNRRSGHAFFLSRDSYRTY